MAGADLPSLEELVRQHNIVYSPISPVNLETGMVLRFGGKLRIVISVAYENTGSGPVTIVETAAGLERLPSDSQIDVWHMDGEPFFVEAPAEDTGILVFVPGGRGSVPPAHDAAGIVPVWRGPKRFNQ